MQSKITSGEKKKTPTQNGGCKIVLGSNFQILKA
jgi:hypothetical protein